MRSVRRLSSGFLVFLIVSTFFAAMFFVSIAGATDYCDMARDVAEDAAKVFPEDKEKGVKLFIKALELCDQPLYQYNLGIAYFKYGNPVEAEKYLAKAVAADGNRAQWLNDYAVVILARGGDAKKALKLAEKAYRLAGDGRRLGPAIAETLAQAQLLTGEELTALKGIQRAARRWSDKSQLQDAAKKIESRFVQAALQLMRKGKQETGFAVLEKGAEFSSLAAQTLCRALSRAGKGTAALAKAAVLKGRYPKLMKDLWSELVAAESANLCARFKAGDSREAMHAARRLREEYSFDKELKELDEKLYKAYLDDDTIVVVAAKPKAPPIGGGGDVDVDVDQALDGLFGDKPEDLDDDMSLAIAVDQDENIRQGKKQRPHGIAVVIGNQHYAKHGNNIPDVKYAKRDAAIMKKYLIKTMGFMEDNILPVYNDATSSELQVLFGTRERPKGKLYDFVNLEEGKAEVFIYYAGHGAPSEKGGEAYLVPVNAEINYIETSGYSLSLFYHNLEALPAKSVMVVLDACFSGDSAGGQLFENMSSAMLVNVNPIQDLKGKSFLLCGADKNQVCAWYPEKRHSLMTYYFFEALQGHADENGDDKVTAGELFNYVHGKVSRKALRIMHREQTPSHRGKLDFVLAEFE